MPGYLSDSEADGVCVINWYHRQFKLAAKERYFKTDADYLYFHSYMSDFFLGRYGGGIPKAFRYTEIQKHRFNLKSKDSEADRQVPAMPLVFYTKEGKIKVMTPSVQCIACFLFFPKIQLVFLISSFL